MVRAKLKGRSGALRGTRSQIDIMACIMNVTTKAKVKTHIMYRCNLSYRQLTVYLKLLVNMGLLNSSSRSRSNETVFFKTSAKGNEFLSVYRKLKALMV